MAVLRHGRMGLEVTYGGFDECAWLEYQIRFLVDDQPFVKDEMLHGTGASYWHNRIPGGFKTQEHFVCSLLPTIEQVLESTTTGEWIPGEPWFKIEFVIEKEFPASRVVRGGPVSKRAIKWYRDRDKQRAANGGVIDGDLVTVIAMAVTEASADDFHVFDSGPALVLSVSRGELRRFWQELKQEYDAIPDKPDAETYHGGAD